MNFLVTSGDRCCGHVSRANQVVLSKWCKPLGFIPRSSHCPVASSPGSFPLDSGNRAYRLLRRSNERSSTLLISLCSPQFVSAVELGRYWYIAIFTGMIWYRYRLFSYRYGRSRFMYVFTAHAQNNCLVELCKHWLEVGCVLWLLMLERVRIG